MARSCDKLPINISAADCEERPEFAKLLNTLSCHLTSEARSTSLEAKLSEAESCLRHEKLKWLQYHILYSELQEYLLEQELKLNQTSTTSNNDFYTALRDSLTYAELGDYINCHNDPSSEVTLLGLDKENVHKRNPHHKHIPGLQQRLIPEMECRLRKKCENLVNFHECSSMSDKESASKHKFSKCTDLPGILENEKRQLKEERKLLKKEKQDREHQFWQYYQALLDSINILENLIKKHQLHTQSNSDSTTKEWLTARCDAMCLKIKMFEVQLMCDTYYAETVKALTKIRNHLDVSILETQHDLSTTGHALKAYKVVGSGFDDLVKSYTHLRDELDNKKWAMKELKESLDKD